MSTQSPWFRKWYKAEVKKHMGNMSWFVVRVDKPEAKGQYIGPARLSGRSCAEKAQTIADAKNAKVLQKRSELLDETLIHDND